MHFKGVAHCDIKPANVLVDQKASGMHRCALTDFGISHLYSDKTDLVKAFVVTNLRDTSILYAAPEVVVGYRNKREDTKESAYAGDVYSFGMVVYDVQTLQRAGWRYIIYVHLSLSSRRCPLFCNTFLFAVMSISRESM